MMLGEEDPSWTALHYAMNEDDPSLVERLLRDGADPNAQDVDGQTPLWIVIDNEMDAEAQAGTAPTGAIVKLLLEAGADPRIRAISGVSSLDLARRVHHSIAVALILDRYPELRDPPGA